MKQKVIEVSQWFEEEKKENRLSKEENESDRNDDGKDGIH
jgi:hypothetical protein